MKLAKFSAKLVANFRRSLEGDFRASLAGENSQKHFPPKLHRKFHHQSSLRESGLWRALHLHVIDWGWAEGLLETQRLGRVFVSQERVSGFPDKGVDPPGKSRNFWGSLGNFRGSLGNFQEPLDCS